MAASKRPDIVHPEIPIGQAFRQHMPQYADMCPVCSVALVRTRNIARSFAALREFGYSTLTREEVEKAYDNAIAGVDPGSDIIARFVQGFCRDAGLIPSDRVGE